LGTAPLFSFPFFNFTLRCQHKIERQLKIQFIPSLFFTLPSGHSGLIQRESPRAPIPCAPDTLYDTVRLEIQQT